MKQDLYLLLKDYVKDPQKAIDTLVDALEKNRDEYCIDDVISAMRGYQGEQLIELAKREGIDVYQDLEAFATFLRMQDEFEGD